MFFRTKSSGPRTYLQVVENRWQDGRSRQRVVATLGRLDQLRDSGQLDALLISGARLAHSVMILSAHAQGRLPVIRSQRIGPALIFEHRCGLFSELQLVFFDTTSIYFEGQGGESLGQRGYSKDHRPDLRQMIVGAVLDGQGRPICCELWPGNTTDVTTLIPVADRLRARFGIGRVCIVADRGMISKETIEALEQDRRGGPDNLGGPGPGPKRRP